MTVTAGGMITKDRKAVLTEKLADAARGIPVFGLKFVRIQHSPGETFFHYICDDHNGGRHYLEVAVKERI
jgi:hypothetical protein